MMVEAGGTEKAWELYEDGAPKVTEEVIADGPRGVPRSGSRSRSTCSSELVDAKAGTADRAARVHAGARLRRRRLRARVASTPAPTLGRGDDDRRQDRAQRRHRRGRRPRSLVELAGDGEFAGPREARSRRRSARCRRRSCAAASSTRASASTAVARPTSGRCRAEVGVIPTAHGSGLFQRGETQVLSVLTLGMPRMEQMLDTIGARRPSKRYMHHYNFPPFSTGETGRVGSPEAPRDRPRRARRAGAAAGRARAQEEWPYTLRVVSEVLASNGSTSMASVCGSTLSLMDAGVPIKAPVAGIAMGLVYADGKYTTLTDILGAEDAFGDMDFKVAGTVRVRHRAAARHEDRRPPGRRARRRRCSRPRTPA